MKNRNLKMERLRKLVAEGFAKRQRIRQQKLEARREYDKAYRARKALEAALALKRNSAFPSSPAVDRGKLPKAKSAAGGSHVA